MSQQLLTMITLLQEVLNLEPTRARRSNLTLTQSGLDVRDVAIPAILGNNVLPNEISMETG